jgi:hypothetical protein
VSGGYSGLLFEWMLENLIMQHMDWVEHHRPMTCDSLLKWIKFEQHDAMVRLQDIMPQGNMTISEVLAEQLHKLAEGNDNWALVAIITEHHDETKM